MLFIPQEVKDQIAQLEEENAALKAELENTSRPMPELPKARKNSGVLWLLVLALLVSVAANLYLFFVVKPAAKTTVTEPEAVVMRDGKLEKWNRVEDGSVVYRVQFGAYQDFNLDKYKQNLEGLYQDSINGFTKISLGAFTRFADAQSFQDEMVKLGFQNVYIVAYEGKTPIGLLEATKK